MRRTLLPLLYLAAATLAADQDCPRAHAAARPEKPYTFQKFTQSLRPTGIVGVAYEMGDCIPMPLGGLGTGTVSIDSYGCFDRNGLMNNPRPQGGTEGCFFALRSDSPQGKTTRILQGKAAHGLKPIQGLKFLGHFPILDMDYETDLPVEVSVQAMTPLIYRDSKNSGLPAIMFTFSLKNKLEEPNRVSLAFSWLKPSPDSIEGMSVVSRGNVGAIARWSPKTLPPGGTQILSILHPRGESAEDLARELKRLQQALPRLTESLSDEPLGEADPARIVLSNGETEFAIDRDGCFNWENWRKETFTSNGVPTVGQHYFSLHYDDGNPRVAGVAYRPSTPNELRNLALEQPSRQVSPHSAVTKLVTVDGTIAVKIATVLSSRSVIRVFHIANRSGKTLRNVELRYFVNYDVGGPGQESDDLAGYRHDPLAAVVTDASNKVLCGLAGYPRPAGLLVGEWGRTRDLLFAGDVESPPDPSAAGNPPQQPRTRVSQTPRLFMLSHEIPCGSRVGGYTIAAFKEEGVRFDSLEEWRPMPQATVASDPWRRFEEEGTWARFETDGTSSGTSREAMALSVGMDLKAQEERKLRFLLTWFFPDQRDSQGNFIGHMYSNWFRGSEDVADYVSERWSSLSEGTAAWQESIYGSSLPDWLKDSLVNSLYSLARNTLWIEDGRFAHSESFIGCPITETIVCRFYGSIPIAMFFPDLERNVMFQFAALQRADGAIPFSFGQPELFDSPAFETQKSLDSSEFVLMAYRDHRWWNDDAFLQKIYPHVKRAVLYARTLDTDDDGVINEVSMQYYDIWRFQGTSAYVGTIWLAALRAAEEMAKSVGDASFAEECRALFLKGSRSFDAKLWNGKYYRLYNDPLSGELSETCLGNQLVGQWFGYSAGLGEFLPKKKILSSLGCVARLNASASPFGLVNGVRPDGTADTSGQYHSSSITIGETFCYAATCLYAGGPDIGIEMAARLYENVALRLRTPWNTTWNMDPKTGQLGWGAEYYSNMCCWDLIGALLGVRDLNAM